MKGTLLTMEGRFSFESESRWTAALNLAPWVAGLAVLLVVRLAG